MIDNVPLVGSLSTGFGDNTIATPNQKTPNLKEASQEFVSMLYAYMFSQMRESSMSDEEDGLFSGDHANMMMGFLDQEIGKKMAGAEGAGLSNALLRQLQQQNGGDGSDSSAEAITQANGAGLAELMQGQQKIPALSGVDKTLASLNKVDDLGNRASSDDFFSSSPASGFLPMAPTAAGGFQPPSLGNMNQPLTLDDSGDDSSSQMMDELYKLNRR